KSAAPATPVVVKTIKTAPKVSKVTKRVTKGAKKVSPYNKYMKAQLPIFKAKNPGISHKEAFIGVAKEWAMAPENPKSVAAK
ncbi:hypothetical protein LPJ66_012176, partial [Kickxella alabastrina]